MIEPLETISLANGKQLRLRFSRRATFRLESVSQSSNLSDYVALCNLVWALQDTKNPRNTPEDIAEMIADEDFENVASAVERITKGALPGESKDDSKNGHSSESD